MSRVSVGIEGGRSEFRPGEAVEVSAGWDFDSPPSKVEARLFWYTQGKGIQDVGVVQVITFEAPQSSDRRDASFTLPESPYSFSGKLITLTWAIEVVAEPSGESARAEITLSPTGKSVPLQSQA